MLTDKKLQGLRVRDKEYSLVDLHKLYIRVQPTGSFSWIFRFYWEGKAKKITLGSYKQSNPTAGITLDQARKQAVKLSGVLENGINPSEYFK